MISIGNLPYKEREKLRNKRLVGFVPQGDWEPRRLVAEVLDQILKPVLDGKTVSYKEQNLQLKVSLFVADNKEAQALAGVKFQGKDDC